MKNLPKSIEGALITAAYLLLAGYLILGFAFGSGGPHGEAGTSFIYAWVLTLPLSAFVMLILGFLEGVLSSKFLFYLYVGGLAVCAIINAVIIYLAVGFILRGLVTLFRKSTKSLK